ncbi:MAG TPA: RsbRD N-terminal domain-containing protein [Bryobacteraceae bacterium]|nr:RsbRD N-terminal domain-containing protein [Bryobacteraceae bacterium]
MQTKEAIAREWLACLLRTYPGQSAGFLAAEQDPFRNPVGHTFHEALGTLLDELMADMHTGRVRAALGSMVQIRAVQDATPAQALEFLFQLKPILRRQAAGPDLDHLYTRIDQMALMAFDLYMQYRERTYAARTNEARRRIFVLERRFGPLEAAACQPEGTS